MRRLFQELLGALENGEGAVLVTIIASSGSTPRGAGSRMLVKQDGACLGTVGGGAVEYQAQCTAREALAKKASCVRGFTLTRNQVADIGMVCGGDVVVYFQYVGPEDAGVKDFCREVLEALERDEDSWLVLDITEETAWSMGLFCAGKPLSGTFSEDCDREALQEALRPYFTAKAVQVRVMERKYYCEPLVQAGTVYIFGGGHVAQELVPVLARVGFRCVVCDDRAEFANPDVFPQAADTIVMDLEHIADHVDIRPQDYVCVMTRGHQFDYYVQKQAMEKKPHYIGIMGSRNKIRVVTEKLLGDGFTLEEIQNCHMPIGTAIGAETPAEIAVSIAGELIHIRAQREERRKC